MPETMIEQQIDSIPADDQMPPDPLKKFARRNRLKGYSLDECGDPQIVGKFGHLYIDEKPYMFGVCLIGAGTKALERRRRMGLAAGLEMTLECDFGESLFVFDSRNREHSSTAIKMTGVRRKRKARPSDLRNLSRMLEKRGIGAPAPAISGT